MRQYILAAVALLCAAGASAEGSVTWLNKVHDFGAFDEDTKHKTAYFRFVNTTDEPVSVVSATATCGCTVPKYSEEPVAVGDTAVIAVSYDPSGRPGRFEKQVYVRTSDAFDRTRLLIKGTVIGNPETIKGRYPVSIGDLKLRTGAAMIGKAYHGHQKVYYSDGYNMSADTIQPVLVSGPQWIRMECTPQWVAPGEMASLDIYFEGERCSDWGIVTDSIMIAAKPGAEAYAYPVVVIVEEDFSTLSEQQRRDAPVAQLSVDKLELKPIPTGSTTPVAGSVKVTNRGVDPLIIRRVYSQDPGVSVSVDSECVKKNKSADVRVTFDPSVQPTGIVNARITIITNDPDNPTRTVRVVGERD